MSGKLVILALVGCFVSANAGTILAVKIKKVKLPIISHLGFLTVSTFLAYLLSLIVHVLFPYNLLYEAIISGLIYPLIFVNYWLSFDF